MPFSLADIDAILHGLLRELSASRVTLRQDLAGEYAFPVTHEVLADGVASLVNERTVDLRTQPVVQELLAGRQVVQPDCAAAFADPAFHTMLATYGGLAAQIVTPVFAREQLAGILSLHQLRAPRDWSESEIATCSRAAAQIGGLL
jgi:GAF domain-containing protein